MSNSDWDVTDNVLPGYSEPQNFLKNNEGGFLMRTEILPDSFFEENF